MKSVMTHSFSQVPKADIPRASFDRSHGHKTAFNAGDLVPIFVDEALPGDTFRLNLTAFARMATPIHPLMDNIFMDTHFFEVPLRLVWDNWKRFNGEQDDPGDSIDFTVPQIVSPNPDGFAAGGLEDYMGIPPGIPNLSVSALFHRSIALIWNEWFRDQNLQQSIKVPKGDGPDDPSLYKVNKRGKRHDYFTSCLPWPNKNGVNVTIPLGQSANVRSDANTGNAISVQAADNTWNAMSSDGSTVTTTTTPVTEENKLYADLSSATAANINQLRQAFQIQKLLERDARGGTRYTEIIRSHFGVVSPDARQQRPIYLGGGSTAVNIHQVPQTESTGQTTPQGNLAAYGTVGLSNNGFTKSFTEHSIIVGFCSVRADLNYQQGVNRMFSRKTRYDFYWPALSHIGEQAVLRSELYAQGTADDNLVFGYQERNAEYRYKPSMVSGVMRSSHPQTLHAWHLSQNFSAAPELNSTFIEENPPIDRVIAVTNQPQFIFDSYIDLRCARPMPLYGVPGLIDHF